METRNVEISALRTLRSGFLYLLISDIVQVLPLATGSSIYDAIFSIISYHPTPISPMTSASALIIFIILLVATVMYLYATLGKIRPGMRQLSEVDSAFRMCYTGTTVIMVAAFIVVVGLVIAIAVLVSLMLSSTPPLAAIWILMLALAALAIGGIMAYIGNILSYVVGAFKLHGKYQYFLYMVAGILFVVDILVTFLVQGGILSAGGDILMYIALGNTINKLSTVAATLAHA